eukprot:5888537-Pleurochrysis_carterae.AAC.3
MDEVNHDYGTESEPTVICFDCLNNVVNNQPRSDAAPEPDLDRVAMADMREILGLTRQATPGAAAPKPKMTIKKPEGMSREVFALLHADPSSSIPLVPTQSPRDAFKEKHSRIIGCDIHTIYSLCKESC